MSVSNEGVQEQERVCNALQDCKLALLATWGI